MRGLGFTLGLYQGFIRSLGFRVFRVFLELLAFGVQGVRLPFRV